MSERYTYPARGVSFRGETRCASCQYLAVMCHNTIRHFYS